MRAPPSIGTTAPVMNDEAGEASSRARPFSSAGSPIGSERSGRDRVDADPVRREFERCLPGQVDKRGLGGDIGVRDERIRPQAGRGRGNDDPAGALPAHGRGARLQGGERAGQVHREHLVPCLVQPIELALGLDRGHSDPGVDERDVEPAVAAQDVSHELAHLGHVGDIDRGRVHPAGPAREPCLDILQPLLIDVGHGHVGAAVDENLGDGPPEPAATPRDQRVAAVDREDLGHRPANGWVHRRLLRPFPGRRHALRAPSIRCVAPDT